METQEPVNSKPNISKILIPVLIIVVGVGVLLFSTRKNNNGVIDEKKLALDEQQEQKISDEVKKYQGLVSGLSQDSKESDRYDAYFGLAHSYYLLGRYKDASDALDKIAAENPNDIPMIMLYANIYFDRNDLGKARDIIEKATQLDPENKDAWLTFIRMSKGASEETINDLYQQALEKTFRNIDVVTSYAAWSQSVDKLDIAKEYWLAAIKINPEMTKQYQEQIDKIDQIQETK